MRNVFVYVLGLCIALWLGGLVALFMFVSALFMSDRATAVLAAPRMFHLFDRYQIALAGVALVCTIGWRLFGCSWLKKVLLFSLLLAMGLSVLQIAWVTPSLDGSRNVDRETFDRMHIISRWVYQGIAVLVLIAGGFFLRAIQAERNVVFVRPKASPAEPQTSPAAAQA